MNQRIRELHSQCKVCDKDTVVYFDYERFAELIIRECAEQVKNLHANKRISGAEIIREHFGVEE